MFCLEEATAWIVDEVLDKLRTSLPSTWDFSYRVEEEWYQAVLMDGEGVLQWSGSSPDPKLLFLDALGWILMRKHVVKNPVWKPREQEVPLYNSSTDAKDVIPDPLDLDPDEIETIRRNS